ncbi:hypothetical protein Gotur_035326 [Gossypium turneri]
MCSFVKVRGVNVPVTEMEIPNRREGDVDISNENGDTRNIQPGTNDAKSQNVDEICLLKNLAYHRNV